MAKPFSYVDALKVFDAGESKLLVFLDRLAGGILLGAAAAGVPGALSLFDAKSEAARLVGDLFDGISSKLRGKGRVTRGEVIAAAHAVIVIAAYFDVMEEVDLPLGLADLDLARDDQLRFAIAMSPTSQVGDKLSVSLLDESLAKYMNDVKAFLPQPHRPFEEVQVDLLGYYSGISRRLLRFVPGLAVWEQLDETRRANFSTNLRETLPRRAVERYVDFYHKLAADVSEFGYWASSTDHSATRVAIRGIEHEFTDVKGTLAEFERLFSGMKSEAQPGQRRALLSQFYRAALDQPIAVSGEIPGKLHLPRLGSAYIDPCFRVTEVPPQADPSAETWWEDVPVRRGLGNYLIGYLTSHSAAEAPLVILGQPGAGKSVLTKMLAAELPAGDFTPVRVPLNEAPAEGSVQDQIEYSLREAIGQRVEWRDLANEAAETIPVVMLDGFDELLQATGVNRSDYLKKVAEFQRRERDFNNRVAIIVTTRMAVADRASFPTGSVALRLEPFTDDQIASWLQVWNDENSSYFIDKSLQPLTTQTALSHRHLSEQPLLLLMLALYDADKGELQSAESKIGTGKLYERLLERFTRREVEKRMSEVPAEEVDNAVQRELLRLSIVAFAMFNRGRQWVTISELDTDLKVLFDDSPTRPSDFRAPLSPAEIIIGRFFFMHGSHVTRDNRTRSHAYEFLHSTFGEYLIARLISKELSALAEQYAVAVRHTRKSLPGDDFLYAVLSFSVLAPRRPIIDFLLEFMNSLDGDLRSALFDLLIISFREAFNQRTDSHLSNYKPSPISITRRHAAYSANLFLLSVILKRKPVTLKDLLPGGSRSIGDWTAYSGLWKSQLSELEWEGLIGTIRARRLKGEAQDLGIRFSLDGGEPVGLLDSASLGWHYRRPDPPEINVNFESNTEVALMLREAAFISDRNHDALINGLAPYFRYVDAQISPQLASATDDGYFQPATWLLQLRLASANGTGESRLQSYRQLLHRTVDGISGRMASILLRQLHDDCAEIPVDDVLRLLGKVGRTNPDDLSVYLDIIEHLVERKASSSLIRFFLEDVALLCGPQAFGDLLAKRPLLGVVMRSELST